MESAERDRRERASHTTHNADAAPTPACFWPTLHTLFFFGQDRHIRRISTLATHGGWTAEFRVHRATFTVHAPARHGSSCAFVLQDLGGPATLFSDRPTPCFRTGRAHSTVFNSHYPRRLDYRVSCASGHVYCPCSGSASRQRHLVLLDLAARRHRPRRPGIFNTEFPPATFSSQPRFRRLVGQSEFQSGADFRPSSHFAILISRFSSLDSELSGASAGDSNPAVCGIHLHHSD